jgi:hypothetical protein
MPKSDCVILPCVTPSLRHFVTVFLMHSGTYRREARSRGVAPAYLLCAKYSRTSAFMSCGRRS